MERGYQGKREKDRKRYCVWGVTEQERLYTYGEERNTEIVRETDNLFQCGKISSFYL